MNAIAKLFVRETNIFGSLTPRNTFGMKWKKEKTTISNLYNHTPYTRAHKLRINPTIQKAFTISFSLHPSLSK